MGPDRALVLTAATVILLIILSTCPQPHSQEPADDAMTEEYFLQSSETVAALCMDADTRERIRKLLLEALDQSFKDHVEKMFETWMRVYYDAEQVNRARVGVRNGINAYLQARKGALKWTPMQC